MIKNKGGRRTSSLFGQTKVKSNRSSAATRYQRQFGKSNRRQQSPAVDPLESNNKKVDEAAALRRLRQEQGELIDAKFGYNRLEDLYQEQQRSRNFRSEKPRLEVDKLMQRRGWLFNMAATTRIDPSSGDEMSGLDLYFVDNEGENFKTTVIYRPYFYVLTKNQDDMFGTVFTQKIFRNALSCGTSPNERSRTSKSSVPKPLPSNGMETYISERFSTRRCQKPATRLTQKARKYE